MKSIHTFSLIPYVDISSHIDRILPEEKLRCATPQYLQVSGGINISRIISREIMRESDGN
jgi:6-phosphofructokinase 2